MAKLIFKNLQHDGTHYPLRISEKGVKACEIPVCHDLQTTLLS